MVRHPSTWLLVVTLAAPVPAAAQARLTLGDAIARARVNNLDIRARSSAEREAAARVSQARGAFFPKVDLTESWQRGDQPVFVFSSLLAQRQFEAANFAIDALNHPASIDNFRTLVTVEQPLFAPATAANLRTVRIGREITVQERAAVDLDLAVDVTGAFGQVLVAVASKHAAAAAVAAATADRERAGHRRDAGRATDADVLQLDVYVARIREQHIRAETEERIARTTLNQLIGEPLDSLFMLDATPASGTAAAGDLATLEADAVKNRPDLRIAALQEQQASAARDSARASFLPQVSAQAGWEMNGGHWGSRSSSWVVGAVARVNLFRGLADRARVAEATEQLRRRALEREKAETTVRLDLRIALARLDDARARDEVGRASVAQARESQRIVRDRYESGLADVVALLRAAEAVQEADARQAAAEVDLLLAAATIDRALGKR